MLYKSKASCYFETFINCNMIATVVPCITLHNYSSILSAFSTLCIISMGYLLLVASLYP